MKSPSKVEPRASDDTPAGRDSSPSASGSESRGTGSTQGSGKGSGKTSKNKKSGAKRAGTEPNNVRKLRQAAMMSKAELARRAGVSPLTIDRVEAGCPCRMDTKRKILEALGLSPSARAEVWPDIDNQA
jgi:DNA-binding XRE family transcriptional regulator